MNIALRDIHSKMGNGPSTIPLTLSGWTLIDSGETPLKENFFVFFDKVNETLRVVIKPLYIGGYKLSVIENSGKPEEVQTIIVSDIDTIQNFLENRWGRGEKYVQQVTP